MKDNEVSEILPEYCPFTGQECWGYAEDKTCAFWDTMCNLATAMSVIADDDHTVWLRTENTHPIEVRSDDFFANVTGGVECYT